jgi:hypothetical protein
MNNYLDLLDTDLEISIELVLKSTDGHAQVLINGVVIYNGNVTGTVNLCHTVPVLHPIALEVHHRGVYLDSLKFDGWESRPQYAWEINNVFCLDTKVPFYQWQHTATAQGWLLTPQ